MQIYSKMGESEKVVVHLSDPSNELDWSSPVPTSTLSIPASNFNITRVCSSCHKEKSLSEFVKDKYRKDGYTSNCKVCRLAQYRANHPREPRQLKVYPGLSVGKLTVISLTASKRCLVRCECGTEKNMLRNSLTRPDGSRSCGCGIIAASVSRATHGMYDSPEYTSWAQMIQRCTNLKASGYEFYGGRGIGVCDKWRLSFESFFSHVGLKPTPKHSIERIDVNGNYEPGNVRWATPIEQARNTRRNRTYFYQGKMRTVAELAAMAGVSYTVIFHRMRVGWPIDKAMTIPSLRAPK